MVYCPSSDAHVSFVVVHNGDWTNVEAASGCRVRGLGFLGFRVARLLSLVRTGEVNICTIPE